MQDSMASTFATVSEPGNKAVLDHDAFEKMLEVMLENKPVPPKYMAIKISAAGVKIRGLNPAVAEGLFQPTPMLAKLGGLPNVDRSITEK